MGIHGADVNLLFGILALQVDFINRDELIDGMQAWSLDKSRSLGEILVEQGALKPDQRQPVDMLVEAHLKNSDNDPEKSLMELTSAFGVPEELSSIEDGEIEHTLSHVSSAASGSIPIFSDKTPKIQDMHFGKASSDSGRFERIELHEEGGLGTVWIAADKELDRRVAIKEMKERYADDEASRKRFVLEAEVTGGLEHPGVVPVYGYGKYADGRPFYAMRFIRGKSLKEAIAAFHKRDFSKQRVGAKTVELHRLLNRFIDVCNTIYFAHRRGILHRDIKPSNIMLGEYGETLVVDWGLAKSIDRDKADEAVDSSMPIESTLMPRSGSSVIQTMMGHAVGSPPYMSPEQARGEQNQLGPATDIYSLGATLYTILTNERPIDGTTTDEILRRVREGKWKKPRTIRGDIPRPLESICIKAMALSQDDRYPSVRRLVRDIEQCLADEPVSAHRESVFEKVRRIGRRNRSLVVAGLSSLLLISLISTFAAFMVNGQRMKAESARTKAESLATDKEKLRQLESVAKEEAIASKERSDRVRNFLVDIIGSANPEKEGGQVTVVQLLDSVDRIDERFADDPLLCSEMLRVIGETYLSLGKITTAVEYAEESYRTSIESVGETHPNTLESRQFLANAYLLSGQHKKALEESKSLYKAQARIHGQASLEVFTAKQVLAKAHLAQGKKKNTEDARKLLANIYAEAPDVIGEDHIETLETATSYAEVLIQLEDYKTAGEMAKKAYDDQLKHLGADHPLTLRTMTVSATAMEYSGRIDDSIAMHEAAVEARQLKLGETHIDTVSSEYALALAYIYGERFDEAGKTINHLNSLLPELRATVGVDNTLPVKITALKVCDSAGILPVFDKTLLRQFGAVSTNWTALTTSVIQAASLRGGGGLAAFNLATEFANAKIADAAKADKADSADE